MPNYRRNFVPGGTYFFTVNLLDRKQDLLIRHVNALRAAVTTVRRSHPFEIVAWVVLPDHMHCIWTLPPGDANYSERWRLIKLLFARAVPKGEPISSMRKERHERGIWQRRFWEHTIRDEADLNSHIDYIHYNPVKHGHAIEATEWSHSTIHRFIKEGVLETDWGDSAIDGAFGEA
jgi:putative transposase